MALNTVCRSDAAAGGKTSINSLIVLNIRLIFNYALEQTRENTKKWCLKKMRLGIGNDLKSVFI
jgi:hypothetical protein